MAHTASADSFLVVDLITIIGYILGPDLLELTILKYITGIFHNRHRGSRHQADIVQGGFMIH